MFPGTGEKTGLPFDENICTLVLMMNTQNELVELEDVCLCLLIICSVAQILGELRKQAPSDNYSFKYPGCIYKTWDEKCDVKL